MVGFNSIDEYDTVEAATEDILRRIDELPDTDNWLAGKMYHSLIPEWTEALRGFEVNTTVSVETATRLEQIINLYEELEPRLRELASEIGSGRMATLDESHVLFIALFRDLQRRTVSHKNMNPHKLRVLLDGRFKSR